MTLVYSTVVTERYFTLGLCFMFLCWPWKHYIHNTRVQQRPGWRHLVIAVTTCERTWHPPVCVRSTQTHLSKLCVAVFFARSMFFRRMFLKTINLYTEQSPANPKVFLGINLWCLALKSQNLSYKIHLTLCIASTET